MSGSSSMIGDTSLMSGSSSMIGDSSLKKSKSIGSKKTVS